MLTHLFKQRFEKEVPVEGIEVPVPPAAGAAPGAGQLQMAPEASATTNILSAADRSKIIKLADAALSTQQRAVSILAGERPQDARSEMQLGADFVQEIIDLLPKPPPQQNQQQDKQQQPQDKPDEPEDKPDDPQDEPPDDQDPPPEQDKPEDGEEPPEETPAEEQPADESPDDISLLLQKALEREQEYQDRKRERNRNAPMLPSERDY